MPDTKWLVVLVNIAAMFSVIVVGFIARKRSFFTAATTDSLSRFVVDITLPALVLSSMINTVDAEQLHRNWFLPLIGAGILFVGQLIGLFTCPLIERRDQRRTFVFLVASANWVYLPLPIAKALYGAQGEQAVLLFNVGAQIILWTTVIGGLKRRSMTWESLKPLALNPGLLATFGGIFLALAFPGFHTLVTQDSGIPSLTALIARSIDTALGSVGSLTIPLSMIVTGAQLGALNLNDHRPSLTLVILLIARLVVTPAAVIALLVFLGRSGLSIGETPRMVAYIIAAMPVAVSSSMFTARYGGDTSLASRSIFYTTLWSIGTVPAIFFYVQKFGF